MIEIQINTDAVQQALDDAADKLTHRAPLMRSVATRLHRAVDDNFNAQGRPEWAGLKTGSWLSRAGALTKHGRVSQARYNKKVVGGKILQNTGRLRNSITEQSDNDSAVVGTNVVYAAIHNFGGQTAAHVIYPRNKKALAWATGMYPVKKVNHPGSKIPARPFMVLTPEDEADLVATVSDYLATI
ncbi:MAG: phage virion morphogenesis protein [Eikenella sp.]|nr:phage virion morphogenesis protein [Eikenella sp.]